MLSEVETVAPKPDPEITPTDSIAVKLIRRPGRALLFLIRLLWAVIVLIAVCILWVLLFLLFLPFLIVSELFGWKAKLQRDRARELEIAGLDSNDLVPLTKAEAHADDEFVFDRRRDVSKLFGCNTRNVQYRWDIFARRLAEIKNKFKEPRALDFGAGSLRDSYELSKLGFRVVSVDLDENLLRRYYDSYDWTNAVEPPQLFANSLDELLGQTGLGFFHLAIAFDVIEHLEDPESYLGKIASLLHEDGLLFTIVPNRRSIFERYFKYSISRQREKGIQWTPGVPHLQFKTPGEWEEFFERNGFQVLEHDMTIGFFVNDCWNGVLGVPLRVYVCPVLSRLAYVLQLRFDPTAFEEAFCPAWLMERVNVFDKALKTRFRNGFGWNLIGAQRKSQVA